MIEIKTFLYFLLKNFIFEESGEKIIKANVYANFFHPMNMANCSVSVLTRPYVSGKYAAGSQLPMKVVAYTP